MLLVTAGEQAYDELRQDIQHRIDRITRNLQLDVYSSDVMREYAAQEAALLTDVLAHNGLMTLFRGQFRQ